MVTFMQQVDYIINSLESLIGQIAHILECRFL